MIKDEPTKSHRHLSQATGLSYGTYRILRIKDDLKVPFKIEVVDELLLTTTDGLVIYERFSKNLMNYDLLDETFFTDEFWFYLSGFIRKKFWFRI